MKRNNPPGVQFQREVIPAYKNKQTTHTPAVEWQVWMAGEKKFSPLCIEFREMAKNDIEDPCYTSENQKDHPGKQEMFLLNIDTKQQKKWKDHRYRKKQNSGDDELLQIHLKDDK